MKLKVWFIKYTFILGWTAFFSVCQAQLFLPPSSVPPGPSPFGFGFPGSQGQVPLLTPLPSGGPQTQVPTSPLGPVNQEGLVFGGPPGPPIFPNNVFSPGPSSLTTPSGTQGFIPGGTFLGGFPTATTPQGFVTPFTGPQLGTSGFVPQPVPTLVRPPISSFPVTPNIVLSPNAPLILNASLNPVVFRSSQTPAFTFRSGAIQNINISVEVTDPDGVGDIAEISFDFFTDSGLVPQALVLGQNHILRRDDANRRAIFGIENLSLGNITPQALLPFITAFDRSGNRSNTWPYVSFVQVSSQ